PRYLRQCLGRWTGPHAEELTPWQFNLVCAEFVAELHGRQQDLASATASQAKWPIIASLHQLCHHSEMALRASVTLVAQRLGPVEGHQVFLQGWCEGIG